MTTGDIAAAEFADREINERISHLRMVVLGVTQAELAASLGVSTRTIKGWEHPDMPRGAPTLRHARRISELTGGDYAPELFLDVGRQIEVSVALELNRKIDLIMAHLGIEDA